MRASRFSRNRPASRVRARAGSTPDLARTSVTLGTASPAASKARSIFARACSSSSLSMTLCARERTISPPTTSSFASASSASSRNGGASGSSRLRRSCFGIPGWSGFLPWNSRTARTSRSTRGLKPRRVHIPVAPRQRFQGSARDLVGSQPGARDQVAEAHPELRFADQQRQPRGGIGAGEHVQPRRGAVRLPVTPLADVQDHAAADGHHRREHPDDEAVAGEQQRGVAKDDAGRTPTRPAASSTPRRAAGLRPRSPPSPRGSGPARGA